MAPSPSAPNVTRHSTAPADRAQLLRRIAAFEHWVEVTGVGVQSVALSDAVVADGVVFARDRRAALKELISVDPREALAHAVPRGTRRALPAEVTSQLEQPVDTFGDLEVVAVCNHSSSRLDRWTTIAGLTYATYTYGERLHTVTKNRLAVHGIAIDDQLALSDVPYRELDLTERSAASDTIESVVVAVGDTTKTFSTRAALATWSDGVAVAEQIIDPNALTAPTIAGAVSAQWTTGEKSVLWIRAEFPDDPGSPATDDQITAAMAAVSTFYRDVSQNTCSFKTTILPNTVRLATSKSVYGANASSYVTLRNDALELARAYDVANGGTGMYNPDRYDRYIVVFKAVSAYTWAGIGAVAGRGVSLNGGVTGAIAAHELGHNHGLHHSHAWAPSAGSAIGAGTHVEYGDPFDDMGSGQSGNTMGHFNAVQKYNLGYLPADAITTVTQSGVYRIYRHDDRNAAGVRALKFSSSYPGTNYWVEYRHEAPYAGFIAPSVGPSELARLQNGVVVHWDIGPSALMTGQGSYLLDMTPTTTSGVPVPTDYNASLTHVLDDAALALGETYYDGSRRAYVTPVNIGGVSPNEWIDVYVSLDALAGNHAPTVSAAAPSGTVMARSNVTLTASGSDSDGDTVYYRWDFGDGSIGPATASVTHRWLKGGTYNVQCTALDGRGGEKTVTVPVAVDDPLVTWQRQAATLTSHYFYDVIFDGTRFVAVGSFVGAVSTDGVNWTLARGMTSQNYNYAVAYGNGRYVAVGSTSGSTSTTPSITSSTNASDWVPQAPPSGVPELRDIVYAAGRFVAVGRSGTVLTSTDGLAWTSVATGRTNDLWVVRYGGGRFVAAGASAIYLTSTDGVNWQDVSLPNDTTTAFGLVYFQGQWLSITGNFSSADTAKRVAWSSNDGLTWTRLYVDVNSSMFGPIVVANSSLLLGVSRANDGRIFLAESPYDWEAASVYPSSDVGSATNLLAAAEGNGTLVIVGLSGQIYTPAGRPIVAPQASAQNVVAGQSLTLAAQAYATGPFTYQWSKDGATISGATAATLTLANTATADAGTYAVTIRNSAGSSTATIAQVSITNVSDAGRLTNMSIRSQAGAGDETLIVGVTVAGGDGSKKPLLVRATGPSLTAYGVAGALTDPFLEVVPRAGGEVLSNDNWNGDAQVDSVGRSLGAFPMASSTSLDAALYTQLSPGGYSMKVTGRAGAGVALVEVYDATGAGSFTAATPRLSNVSARTKVGVGDDVLIAGFVIGGSTSKRLLIRGIGPKLAFYGVGGVLANPKLELYRTVDGVSTKLVEHDDWSGSEIVAAADSVGAFPLDAGSKDAVLIQSLQPGNYSVVVRGVDDTIGVGMVEVYELP